MSKHYPNRTLVAAAVLAQLLAGCSSAAFELGAAQSPEDGATDVLSAPRPDAGPDAAEVAQDAPADAVDAPDATPWVDAALEAPEADAAPADAVDAAPVLPPTQEAMCRAYGYKPGRARPYTEWEADGSCRTLYPDGSALACAFHVASDGVTRCLPTPIARVIGWTNPTCSSPEVGLTDISSGFTAATVFEASVGAYVVRETSVANVPALWYRIDASGVCAPTNAAFPGGGQVAATTARVIDPTTFLAYPHP